MNTGPLFRKQHALENAIKGAMERFEHGTGLKITSVRVKRTAHRILAVMTTAELPESADIPVLTITRGVRLREDPSSAERQFWEEIEARR